MGNADERVVSELATLLVRFGPDLTHDPKRLRALLGDALGSDLARHRAGVDAVVMAAAAGVADRLSSETAGTDPRNLAEQLVAGGADAETAELGVASWEAAIRSHRPGEVEAVPASATASELPAPPEPPSATVGPPVESQEALGLAPPPVPEPPLAVSTEGEGSGVGDRWRRRRRLAAGIGVAAVLVAVIVITIAVAGGDGDPENANADPTDSVVTSETTTVVSTTSQPVTRVMEPWHLQGQRDRQFTRTLELDGGELAVSLTADSDVAVPNASVVELIPISVAADEDDIEFATEAKMPPSNDPSYLIAAGGFDLTPGETETFAYTVEVDLGDTDPARYVNEIVADYHALDEGPTRDVLSALPRLARDSEAPELLITSPPDGHVTSEARVVVRGTTEPGVTVTIQGEERTAGADGSFEGTVLLEQTETDIRVVAVDAAGNKSEVVRHVTLQRAGGTTDDPGGGEPPGGGGGEPPGGGGGEPPGGGDPPGPVNPCDQNPSQTGCDSNRPPVVSSDCPPDVVVEYEIAPGQTAYFGELPSCFSDPDGDSLTLTGQVWIGTRWADAPRTTCGNDFEGICFAFTAPTDWNCATTLDVWVAVVAADPLGEYTFLRTVHRISCS